MVKDVEELENLTHDEREKTSNLFAFTTSSRVMG